MRRIPIKDAKSGDTAKLYNGEKVLIEAVYDDGRKYPIQGEGCRSWMADGLSYTGENLPSDIEFVLQTQMVDIVTALFKDDPEPKHGLLWNGDKVEIHNVSRSAIYGTHKGKVAWWDVDGRHPVQDSQDISHNLYAVCPKSQPLPPAPEMPTTAAGFDPVNIGFYTDIGFSPAWNLVPRAMAELIDSGFAQDPSPQPPAVADPVLIAFVDDRPVGFLAYRYDATCGSWWIMLSYVLPDHRKHGIHTRLFNSLVERAKARGDILTIKSGTHINNKPAQAAFERQGRLISGLFYDFIVRDRLEPKDILDGVEKP